MTQPDVPLRRRGVSRGIVVFGTALALALGGGGSAGHAIRRPRPAQFQNPPVDEPVSNYFPSSAAPVTAQVTIRAHEKMTRIPRSYLGLSTEYWTLATDEHHVALYKRVLRLLHVPADGRLVLRVGGDSSDHSFWDPEIRRLPRWAFEVTPDWVERTAAIVRALRLRVILDMNLVTGTPLEAGAWAHAAERDMPKGSIIGFEVGNEPDLYDREDWLVNLDGTRFAAGLLPNALTPAAYARDYVNYARVLRRVAPHVPLIAPALANPQTDSDFISTLLAGRHQGLGTISVHRYPYSACSTPTEPTYPTIGRVLSEAASAGMAASVEPALRLARKAHLPLRLTEINSVTCGGLDDVSRQFATALWAPDAIFELIKVGAAAVNLHVRAFAINAPFSFTEQGIRARALLYGMILFTRTLGRDSRLVPLRLISSSSLHLKAWAVRVSRDTMRVLVLNKGPHAVTLRLQIPGTGPATVERMLAPAAISTASVTLAGQQLGDDMLWHGPRVIEPVAHGKHGYDVTVRGISAALVTVHGLRGALGAPP